MRVLFIILCLTAVAVAGPTSWTATEHGPPAEEATKPLKPTSEPEYMDAVVGPLVTLLNTFAVTDRETPDQEGNAQGDCQVWYSLAFSGSDDATDHRWRIHSHILGDGYALANAHADGTGWGDSLQVVLLTGDHKNNGAGQLAVEAGGSLKVMLSVPAGFRIWMDKTQRLHRCDGFDVDRKKTTQGPGKLCRVCADTFLSVRLSASSTFGTAMAHLYGRLRGDLEMSGYCRIGDKEVRDTYRLELDLLDWSRSNVTPPSGGIVRKPDDTPPDTPSDEERETGEMLPVDPGAEATDDPAATDGEGEEEGGVTPPATTEEEPELPPTTEEEEE